MCDRWSCLLWSLLPLLASGQSFTQTFGGTGAQRAIGAWSTPEGYRVPVGEFVGPGPHHVNIHSLTSTGASSGSPSPMDIPYLFLHAVVPGPEGSAFLLGSVLQQDGRVHDGIVTKRNNDGSPVWTRVIERPSSQQHFGGAVLPDGGLLVCGADQTNDGTHAMVFRMDQDGNTIWSHTLTDANTTEAFGIAIQGSHALITGRSVSGSGQSDALAFLVTLAGELVWTNAYGGSGEDVGRQAAPLGTDAFLMAGWTNSYGAYDETTARIPDHVHVVALDLEGDTLWTRAIGDTIHDRRAFGLSMTPNGEPVLCGERVMAWQSDAFIMRLSPTGALLWERVIDTGPEDRLVHVVGTVDGIVASGWSFGEYGSQALFIRRNASGF